MIAKGLITVGDIFKTGYLDIKKRKNPIYHKVAAVYWDNLSKETLFELHFLEIYFLKPLQLEYIKWTILANEQELSKFILVGKQ